MSGNSVVVNLRALAERVGLAPCSVSAVLNRTPASRAIPQQTQDRIFRAAAELNYQPKLSARSLRTKRTHMITFISDDLGRPEIGHLAGLLERKLRQKGYLLALGVLDRSSDWTRLSVQLRQRGIEGVIAAGVSLPRECGFPAVSVHFGSRTTTELSKDSGEPTAEFVESILETLLEKIEAQSGSGKTRIFGEIATTYFIPRAAPASAVALRD